MRWELPGLLIVQYIIVETFHSDATMSTSTAYDPRPRSAASVLPLDDLGAALARNWWLIGLRGVLAVIFGAIALFMPIATILALVLLFSAYMIVDGVVGIYAAIRAARRRESWGFLVFQGIASVAAGAIAFVWPGLTVLAFVLLIAAWSIVSGCLMLAAAYKTENGRWWLALGGAAALLYGILMIVAPLAGAVVLTWWLGAFAVLFGVALMVLALQLRARYNERRPVAAARPVT
jgi:uncharacterized membrane protein HdeD (DUF308 family)